MPEPVKVILLEGALEHAALEARRRRGWVEKHPEWTHRDWIAGGDDKYLTHYHGCCAEIASGKYTGHYWAGKEGCGDLLSADVGVYVPYEVKCCGSQTVRLPVREKDERWHPEMPIVLVTRGKPETEFWLHGWIFIHEAATLMGEREDPNNKGVWAYFVPPHLLRPMPELREYLWQREGELYGLKQRPALQGESRVEDPPRLDPDAFPYLHRLCNEQVSRFSNERVR